MVDDFVGGVGFKHILPLAVLFSDVVEVVVVNNFNLKVIGANGFVVALINVLEDKFTQFCDQVLDVAEHSIIWVLQNLFHHVLLIGLVST